MLSTFENVLGTGLLAKAAMIAVAAIVVLSFLRLIGGGAAFAGEIMSAADAHAIAQRPPAVLRQFAADEVERLGYVVHPLSDHEVLATRGVTELRLTIRAPGPDGKHLLHPTAREDSVVVEIVLA